MKEKLTKSTFLEDSELLAALDVFVQFGILKKTKKNGQDAWINNPDFDKKTKKEQGAIFAQVESSSKIPNEVLASLMSQPTKL